MNKKTSKRFAPTTWSEKLVPVLLLLLLLALGATVAVVVVSLLGLFG